MPRLFRLFLSLLILAVIVVVPFVYKSTRDTRFRNFHVVNEGLNYYRIPPRPWWASDVTVPAEKGIKVFREVMSNEANYPVLVHCFAGIHRTGAYCAVYRMEFDGWTNARAIAEVKDHGYSNLEEDWDILGYLEQYRPLRIAAKPAPTTVRPASYTEDD